MSKGNDGNRPQRKPANAPALQSDHGEDHGEPETRFLPPESVLLTGLDPELKRGCSGFRLPAFEVKPLWERPER